MMIISAESAVDEGDDAAASNPINGATRTKATARMGNTIAVVGCFVVADIVLQISGRRVDFVGYQSSKKINFSIQSSAFPKRGDSRLNCAQIHT